MPDPKIDISGAFAPFIARSRYKAAYGGRGSGKSHFFAEALVGCAVESKGFRAVCVREVQKSLKESAKRLIEDKIHHFGLSDRFEIRNDHIKTPGDGIILFQGMQDHTAESIKSLEGMNVAWAEEAQTMSARSLEMLRPTIRSPSSELWFSWNPRNASDPVDAFFRGERPPPDAIIQRINYNDNPHFPDELEQERLFDLQASPDRYAHIWLGEYEPQAVGAIWDRANFHQNRLAEPPEDIGRIVVAVDPAISADAGSDEHGVIVCGMGENDAYVLEDATTKGTPRQWANRAVAMYDKWEADAIVIERNQGGDMCRFTLESVRPGIKIVEVHATRGKHVRAEPISAQYSLNKVHHVGTFPELEAEMCLMTAAGYEGSGSPDRVDALVWGLTDLFPDMIKRKAKKRTAHAAPVNWMG